MNDKEAHNRLRQARLGEEEIARLWHLRSRYSAEGDQLESLASYRRLQFVRWLVRTGRLSEQTVREAAEEREGSPEPVARGG